MAKSPKKSIFLGFSFPPKFFKFRRIFQIQLRLQKGGHSSLEVKTGSGYYLLPPIVVTEVVNDVLVSLNPSPGGKVLKVVKVNH